MKLSKREVNIILDCYTQAKSLAELLYDKSPEFTTFPNSRVKTPHQTALRIQKTLERIVLRRDFEENIERKSPRKADDEDNHAV